MLTRILSSARAWIHRVKNLLTSSETNQVEPIPTPTDEPRSPVSDNPAPPTQPVDSKPETDVAATEESRELESSGNGTIQSDRVLAPTEEPQSPTPDVATLPIQPVDPMPETDVIDPRQSAQPEATESETNQVEQIPTPTDERQSSAHDIATLPVQPADPPPEADVIADEESSRPESTESDTSQIEPAPAPKEEPRTRFSADSTVTTEPIGSPPETDVVDSEVSPSTEDSQAEKLDASLDSELIQKHPRHR